MCSQFYRDVYKMRDFLTLEMGPMGCPETSVRIYHYWLRNNP